MPQQIIDSVDLQVPPTIPPLGHIDQLTANLVVSPGQYSQHPGSVPTFPSTIKEDQDQLLGVLDHHISSTSHAHVPSEQADINFQDTSHTRQELLADAGREPLIPPPRDLDDPLAVNPIQSITQDLISKRVVDSLEATWMAREQERKSFATEHEHESVHKDGDNAIASLREGLPHTLVPPDNKYQLSFAEANVPWVPVTERDEALRSQLVDLTNLIRQTLALCAEKKSLMEQQWTEGIHWREKCDQQIRELTRMASWLVEDRAMERLHEEHQRQANDDDSSKSKLTSQCGSQVLNTPNRDRESSR